MKNTKKTDGDLWCNLDGTEITLPEIDINLIPELDINSIPELDIESIPELDLDAIPDESDLCEMYVQWTK